MSDRFPKASVFRIGLVLENGDPLYVVQCELDALGEVAFVDYTLCADKAMLMNDALCTRILAELTERYGYSATSEEVFLDTAIIPRIHRITDERPTRLGEGIELQRGGSD